MNDEPDDERSDEGPELEQEIRQGRKFTPQEAMARLAGPGAMKGASPVSPVQQAETEIGNWVRSNVVDEVGALKMLLQRNLRGNQLLLDHLDQPLLALAEYCRRILNSDYLLSEFVRQADVEWGERMDERPHFDRQGSPPAPDDPYTIESVRETLGEAMELLTP